MYKITWILLGYEHPWFKQVNKEMREPIGFWDTMKRGVSVQIHLMKFAENYSPYYG
jgi:hypothetical protein